jgi:hypothetical protein
MFSAVNTLITDLLVFVSPGLQQKDYDAYWVCGRGGSICTEPEFSYKCKTAVYTEQNLEGSFLIKRRMQILTQCLKTGLTKNPGSGNTAYDIPHSLALVLWHGYKVHTRLPMLRTDTEKSGLYSFRTFRQIQVATNNLCLKIIWC